MVCDTILKFWKGANTKSHALAAHCNLPPVHYFNLLRATDRYAYVVEALLIAIYLEGKDAYMRI